MDRTVKVVGIGGSTRAGSIAEQALRVALGAAQRLGAEVTLIGGAELAMPMYDPKEAVRSVRARRLVTEIAAADGLLLASPAYHGTISGLVKNALDHVEDLRTDVRPYFSGRAVGCVAVGQGWQGAVATLGALRDVVHALRGWPTPLGVVLGDGRIGFHADGCCTDPHVQDRLTAVGEQVMEFARMRAAVSLAGEPQGTVR
ncbi:NAD(P)H-dependent oxidoreductase [Streptomyces sp. NPDC051129]|uniref:NADPH-dependent FMN reductase n=1 Tax=Streptomyces sp. NPDC051129 TaxID=3154639 RepID=UPI0034230BC7